MRRKLQTSPRYIPFGDRALIVEFSNIINPGVNRRVHALHRTVSKAKLLGVGECVPTYRSLLITYDSTQLGYEELVQKIKDLEKTLKIHTSKRKARRAKIPVVYGGDYGPDLARVSSSHNLKENEVARIHSEHEYTVYMIGFVAGFPYLGELPEEIATPRLESPRTRVPEGSVGIAEKQTGIYPREAPGGWQIIGRTPVKLFDLSWHPPALLEPGDNVKFDPISNAKFKEVQKAFFQGNYDPFAEE